MAKYTVTDKVKKHLLMQTVSTEYLLTTNFAPKELRQIFNSTVLNVEELQIAELNLVKKTTSYQGHLNKKGLIKKVYNVAIRS